MSVTSTPANTPDVSELPGREAPLTLTTEPPRPLRFSDQLALWANLGISLFGPLTGALIATTAGSLGLAWWRLSWAVRSGRSCWEPRR